MKKRQQNIVGKFRAVTVVLFFCLGISGFFYPRFVSKTFGSPETAPTPPPTRRPKAKPQTRNLKYSEFPHNVHTGKLKLACDSCHKFPTANWKRVRKESEAFPDIADYPKHESCLNCHRQQFFRGAPPVICSICHTNPGPRISTRHAFPNPREIFDLTAKGQRAVSDFAISFPHDKHIDIVSENKNPFEENRVRENAGALMLKVGMRRGRAAEESCSVCHQTYQPQGKSDDEYVTKPPAKLGDAFWLKKGTFKTTPLGHDKCFTCHSADTGINPAPNNCAACHKLRPAETKTDFDAKLAAAVGIKDKIMLASWRKRDSSATFRHEWFSHAELSCATCHNVAAMNTLDAQTKKIKVLSCGGNGTGCHITPTSDDGGALNFEIDSKKTNPGFQCVKCHLTFGRAGVPESHTKAISALAGGK